MSLNYSDLCTRYTGYKKCVNAYAYIIYHKKIFKYPKYPLGMIKRRPKWVRVKLRFGLGLWFS